MNTLEQAARQALEALEEYQNNGAPFMSCDAAVDALRQALEQPKREWVGLTEDMIADLWLQSIAGPNTATKFALAIEAALKEKNT
jgi:hypothetical protein